MESNEAIYLTKRISKWKGLAIIFKLPMILVFLVIVTAFVLGQDSDNMYYIAYFSLFIYILLLFASIMVADTKEVVVTSHRVIFRHKRENGSYRYVPLRQISSVGINSSLFGRIFNYGDLKIDTTGKSTFQRIQGVSQVKTVSETINELIFDL